MLLLLKITGRSLAPDYQEGDYVLTSRVPVLLRCLRSGDVVVFQHEVYGMMIKRVDQIDPARDELFVSGTAEDSVDSRRFGAIPRRSVHGKVIWHFRKPNG